MTDLMFERANSETSIEERKVSLKGQDFNLINDYGSESGLGGLGSPTSKQ